MAQHERPRCTVEGCESTQRKRSWCASHYAQTRASGQPPKPFAYKWASKAASCVVCGDPTGEYGFREFCGNTCSARFRAYDGDPPTERPCVACGISIDLMVKGKGGQRRKATVKFCRPCKRDYNKYKLSARELAVRDGTSCGICGKEVDMDLRRSESIMCASVDHVLPRALGGTHEPENLQLAHLHCNQVKSDLRGKGTPIRTVI